MSFLSGLKNKVRNHNVRLNATLERYDKEDGKQDGLITKSIYVQYYKNQGVQTIQIKDPTNNGQAVEAIRVSDVYDKYKKNVPSVFNNK